MEPGSIAATWSYINTDAKTGYRIGNSLNTATAATVIITSLGLVVYQMRENKKRGTAFGTTDCRCRPRRCLLSDICIRIIGTFTEEQQRVSKIGCFCHIFLPTSLSLDFVVSNFTTRGGTSSRAMMTLFHCVIY